MNGTKQRDWLLIVLGILMVICGFAIWLTPLATLIAITMVAGAGFLIVGIFDIVEFVRFRAADPASGLAIVYAVFDIIIGLLLLLHPVALAGLIPWLVGAGIIVFGIFEAVAAVKARSFAGLPWGWMLFAAIVDILCGVMFIVMPAMLALFVALFVIMRGATLIVAGAVGRTALR